MTFARIVKERRCNVAIRLKVSLDTNAITYNLSLHTVMMANPIPLMVKIPISVYRSSHEGIVYLFIICLFLKWNLKVQLGNLA